jgi:hypothetical protein
VSQWLNCYRPLQFTPYKPPPSAPSCQLATPDKVSPFTTKELSRTPPSIASSVPRNEWASNSTVKPSPEGHNLRQAFRDML